MSHFRKFAASSVLAFLAVATLTSAMIATPPSAVSLPLAPTLTVTVARGDGFDSIDEMRRDFNAAELATSVAAFRARQTDDFGHEELVEALLEDGWDVARIEDLEWYYIFITDRNGVVREFCLERVDLIVIDDGRPDLHIGIKWELEL